MRHWRHWAAGLILLTFGFAACSGSRSRQDDIDEATQYFSLLAQTLVQFFQNDLTKCSSFNMIYDQISTASFDCDNGTEGKFNMLKNNVTCVDGSPLLATADFTLIMDNCADDPNSVTTTGPINFSLNFTSSKDFVLVASPSVVVNGLEFVFSGFEVQIKFSSGNLDCEGEMTVDGENCSVNSNCESCD